MRTKPKSKVNIVTLGCSKNIVDSEVLMAQLRENHFSVSHEKEKKNHDIVVVNTCGFIENAKQESINTILEFAGLKKEKKVKKLFVTGCLSQRYREELKLEIPEVDDWFGTMEMPLLLKRLNADYKHDLVGERNLITPAHYAYLKISEGCNRTCAFCAIPLMRGKHISKPVEEIISEAQKLVSCGVKEIILIAQELTYYGLDIYKERKLKTLLEKLSEVKGLKWIRLHYAYPSKFPVEILDVIRERPSICNYLDIPFQHISDTVLQRMKRQISKAETLALIETIREKIPGIALRTTLLVGFPGENENDFEELKEFVREIKFERLGVFTYSHEEGTSAYQFKDDVPAEIKKLRAEEIMKLQEEISSEQNQKRIGETHNILIDRREGKYFIGRTEFDSPEVDNEVLIDASKNHLHAGDFIKGKIVAAEAFDLYAEPMR